jgi:hypothetical protein
MFAITASVAARAATEPSRDLVGPVNAEDLELIPGTKWIIASGMASRERTGNVITLIDTAHDNWVAAWPSAAGAAPARPQPALYPGCTALPDLAHFSPHGLALRTDGKTKATLYVVNDGPRAGVEIFALDLASPTPQLTWSGCVPAPSGTHPNSVAPLPDGGFVMSSMMSGDLKTAVAGLLAGEPTGEVYRWRADRGLTPVPSSRVSGANGIAVTSDGKTLFINAWTGRQIVRLPLARGGMPKASLTTDFLPDNLKWGGRHQLVATGQAVPFATFMAESQKPGPTMTVPWSVITINPQTMRITHAQTFAATPEFGGASIAVQVGNEWWAGSFHADRIAKRPVE